MLVEDRDIDDNAEKTCEINEVWENSIIIT